MTVTRAHEALTTKRPLFMDIHFLGADGNEYHTEVSFSKGLLSSLSKFDAHEAVAYYARIMMREIQVHKQYPIRHKDRD